MPDPLFKALFEPAVVALIGASADGAKPSSRPQRYLRKHGYTGTVHLVNPGRTEILGAPAVPSLRDLKGVDHAFVTVPSAGVPAVVADCVAAGVAVATIFSDGFADAGPEGMARQNAIVAAARAAGLRLLGPNSMGVINPIGHMALTVNTVMESVDLLAGSLALVSQSGAMIGSLLARAQARGQGFSRLVSVGNEADLSVGEIVDLLVDDSETRAILLFLETLRQPERLARAARRAFAAGKPVVVYKLGRSETGRGLAAAHSGALAGPRENATAFFRSHGIVEIDHLESLFEIAPLVAVRRRGHGRTVAVLTNTGGGAAVVADRLGTLGLDLMPAPAALVERIAAFGIRVGHGPVIDVTAAGTRKEIYQAALEEIVRSPCDAVVVIVGSSGISNPQYAVAPILAVRDANKPIVAFVAPEAPLTLRMLLDHGIAAFRTPEACADSVAAYLNWTAPRSAIPAAPDATVARLLAAAAGPILNEAQSRAVFAALGVPQAKARIVRSAGDAVNLRFPVAAKVVSADVPHKSDAGGVRLHIPDAAALAVAIAEIPASVRRHLPSARIEGILVQEMHAGLAEAIVGYKHDPEVGAIVLLGVGGTLSEIYRDIAVRLAPVSRDEAMAMIDEVRGLAPIRGYRNAAPGDTAALADAICAVSNLAALERPQVREAEINPLIVKGAGQGVVAVDGLIVLGTVEDIGIEHA